MTRGPLPWHPLKVAKVPEAVARRLTSWIVERKLEEGQVLPNEEVMSRELGVSRMALREGLRILQTHGLIEARQGRNGGTIVRQPSSEAITRPLFILLQYQQATLQAVMEALEWVECLCIRRAAERAEEDDLERVGAAMESIRAGETWEFWQCNLGFYVAVAQAAKNPVLTVLIQSLREVLYVSVQAEDFPEDERSGVMASHTRILEALRKKDADAAERRMRRHILALRDYLCRYFGKDLTEVPIVSKVDL